MDDDHGVGQMSIHIACPHCTKEFLVPESSIGRKGRCGVCHSLFIITDVACQPGATAIIPAAEFVQTNELAGVLDELARAESSSIPIETSEDLSRTGGRLLKECRCADAADHFCRAYLANTSDTSNLANCGAAFWVGVKGCFELLARVTVQQCRCGSPELLFIHIIYDWFCGMQLKNSPLCEQVRAAVGYDDACRVEHCIATAKRCFRKACELGDGIALIWLIDVLRSTGEFNACRAELGRAQRAKVISQEHLASAADFVSAISIIESDISWLASAESGWVAPTADRFRRDKLQELAVGAGKVNERLEALLSSK